MIEKIESFIQICRILIITICITGLISWYAKDAYRSECTREVSHSIYIEESEKEDKTHFNIENGILYPPRERFGPNYPFGYFEPDIEVFI